MSVTLARSFSCRIICCVLTAVDPIIHVGPIGWRLCSRSPRCYSHLQLLQLSKRAILALTHLFIVK